MTAVSYQPTLVDAAVVGVRCVRCRRAIAPATPRCVACGSAVQAERFSARGAVWASTVIHIEVAGPPSPYALAYVDLDDGPRVLAAQADAVALVPGTRVALQPATEPGRWCDVVTERPS